MKRLTSFRISKKKAGLFLLFFIFLAVVVLTPNVFILKSTSINVTRWYRNKGKVVVKVGPREKDWTPLQDISKHVVNAVISAEDTRFFNHAGIDPIEMWKSLQLNLEKGRYVRGASTLTQQVVKMTLLSREKTIIRKAREILGALFLEMILSKQEIITWYLNLAEFGDGVYGVKAGARYHFNTKPRLLTISQGVHLALVLPSPNRWSFGLRRKELTEFGHHRFANILLRMRLANMITETQWDQTMASGNFGGPIEGYENKQEEDFEEAQQKE